jgi:sorbitol/mannitol transport system substrate-binding protein
MSYVNVLQRTWRLARQFALVFLGLYETPIFAKRGWLKEMANIPADYDLDDVFKSLRDGLSYDGKLYA